MQVTNDDIAEILNSRVDRFQKRKLCLVCDYFDTQRHAGITCKKCGCNQFYSTDTMKVSELFEKVKKHTGNKNSWMPFYMASFLQEKYHITYQEAMKIAIDRMPSLRA